MAVLKDHLTIGCHGQMHRKESSDRCVTLLDYGQEFSRILFCIAICLNNFARSPDQTFFNFPNATEKNPSGSVYTQHWWRFGCCYDWASLGEGNGKLGQSRICNSKIDDSKFNIDISAQLKISRLSQINMASQCIAEKFL